MSTISNKNESIFTVYLQPGAKKSFVAGMHNGNIKIKINAPDVDGKANKALIDFLSTCLSIPKSSISIVSGEKSRIKKIKIIGMTGDIIKSKFDLHE